MHHEDPVLSNRNHDVSAKMAMGLLAGAAGQLVAVPADLIKVACDPATCPPFFASRHS